MFPDERVSATSIGSSWTPINLVSSTDDATLWIETCLDKIACGCNEWVMGSLELDSISDITVDSTEEPSNFVKSRPDACNSWYEPSVNMFA